MAGLQWSAITSREKHNTRREWFDKHGNFNAQVTLEVASDDRFKLVQDLYTCCYGNQYEGQGGYLPRAYPAETSQTDGDNPNPPVMNKIGVMSVSIGDIATCYNTDESEQVISSNYIHEVQVQYGAFWSIQENLEFETQVITQNHEDFHWKTKLPNNANDMRTVKSLEVPVARLEEAILTREFIGITGSKGLFNQQNNSTPPDIRTFFEGIVGKTNSQIYASQQFGYSFPPETLLLMKPVIRNGMDMQNLGQFTGGTFNNFGGQGYTVQVSFLYKKQGHNKFWRPRMPVPSQSSQTERYGYFDSLTVSWETNPNIVRDFEPAAPDPLIDQHWLIPTKIPRLAPN